MESSLLRDGQRVVQYTYAHSLVDRSVQYATQAPSRGCSASTSRKSVSMTGTTTLVAKFAMVRMALCLPVHRFWVCSVTVHE